MIKVYWNIGESLGEFTNKYGLWCSDRASSDGNVKSLDQFISSYSAEGEILVGEAG